jgi:arylsulfatase A-like enzyme
VSDSYQPNIVFILTDQQRYDTIGALGFDYMETPNLDRLVREGTSFDRCYITAPSCVPSRCSLFQGCYPHTTGVYKNGDTWTESWVGDLAEAGYRCVNVGKMHTVPLATPAGFHERYIVENKDRFLEGRYFFDEWDKALRARGIVKQQRELYRKRDDYGERLGAFTWDLDPDMQSDNFVGGFADWWLRTYPIDKPLFLQVGFPGPHPPYDPTPDWLERYLGKSIPIADFSPDETSAQPHALRALRDHMLEVDHDSVVHLPHPTAEQRHYQRACYLANVSMIDEQIGRLMTTLSEQGMLEDTVIIFASDHGDSLGDHGHSQKWTMYEESVHVPAIVWMGDGVRRNITGQGASAPRTQGGTRVGRLVSLMDIGPTILELAGVDRPEWMEAVSLMPMLVPHSPKPDGDAQPHEPARPADRAEAVVSPSDASWDVHAERPAYTRRDGSREYVFAEHGRDNILEETSVMTMVRDERWKLVTFGGSDEGQLFDLANDSEERNNLWSDANAAGERQRLERALLTWYRESLYATRTRRRR